MMNGSCLAPMTGKAKAREKGYKIINLLSPKKIKVKKKDK